MPATAMTRVAPDAFRRAEAVRGVGLALVRALSVLGGLLPATVAVARLAVIGRAGGLYTAPWGLPVLVTR